MAKLAAKTYGDALFSLALEKDMLDAYMEEAQAVLEALTANKELDNLMRNPQISKEEKIKLIEDIFKNMLSAEMTGFLVIITQKGRFSEISQIFKYFMKRVKEHKRIGDAYITSAVELNEAQKAKVQARLLETTRYQKIDLHFRVDPALIGGVRIRIGDRVVDSSIQTRLHDLSASLRKMQLA